MGKFDGKVLLMLGSNAGAKDMVKYARENGAYTIVTDYLPPEKSEAKRHADESQQISTGDNDALRKLEKHINGILAGISEFNLLQAMELSKEFGFRFYCTKEQWNQVEHKELFRNNCEKNGVPCPKTYYVGSELPEKLNGFQCPAIIKPVDCSSSKGVHICKNETELREGYNDAISNSEKGLIIIEEFVSGDEFTVHYTICDGKATCSCIDNRYPVAVHKGNVTTIPIARIYPSTYIDSYMEKVNPAMLQLCEGLGVKNGVLFVQGIYNRDLDTFWIFEGGLRSAAETPNRFLSRINGIDYMNNIVDWILLGQSDFDRSKENPYMNGKCSGIVSFVARAGRVGKILGLDEAVRDVPSVLDYESRYPVGSLTPDTDTLRQLMIRFVMVCDSREQMARDVEYLNDHITVLNDQGEDMVIKISPDRILTEFGGGTGDIR